MSFRDEIMIARQRYELSKLERKRGEVRANIELLGRNLDKSQPETWPVMYARALAQEWAIAQEGAKRGRLILALLNRIEREEARENGHDAVGRSRH